MNSITISRSSNRDCQSRLPTTANKQTYKNSRKKGQGRTFKRKRQPYLKINKKIPLVLTYSRSLPNISKVVRKHWNILSINKAFKEVFQNEPVADFERNKNLKELIGNNKIEDNKVKKHNNVMKKGKCSPCSANNRTLCCNQLVSSSTFKSQQTNKSYTIFHQLNCSSAYVIYLMECTLCRKQYVGKSETSFNIRLNNHPKDVKKPDAILACRHFQEKNPRFQQTCKVHHYR